MWVRTSIVLAVTLLFSASSAFAEIIDSNGFQTQRFNCVVTNLEMGLAVNSRVKKFLEQVAIENPNDDPILLRKQWAAEKMRLNDEAKKVFHTGISELKKLKESDPWLKALDADHRHVLNELLATQAALEEAPHQIDFRIFRKMAKDAFINKRSPVLSPLTSKRNGTPSSVRQAIEEKVRINPERIPYPEVDHFGKPVRSKKNDEIWDGRIKNARGAHLEGTVAAHIDKKWGDIVTFNERSRDPHTGRQYELDIRMHRALVEVTYVLNGKAKQIRERYFSTFVNPNKLPVILYSPNISFDSGAFLLKECLQLGLPVQIVRSESELDDALAILYR